MGRHERRDNAEGQWPGEALLPEGHAPAPHDGRHRREDGPDEFGE